MDSSCSNDETTKKRLNELRKHITNRGYCHKDIEQVSISRVETISRCQLLYDKDEKSNKKSLKIPKG